MRGKVISLRERVVYKLGVVEYFVSFIGDLATFVLITFIIALTSLTISIISLVLVRRSIKGGEAAPPQAIIKPAEEVSKPSTPPKAEVGARPPPPSKRGTNRLEIKPLEPEEWIGFTSIEELASTIGAKSLILFNQSGIPIESHNVADEDRVAASLADFVSIMRKLNPNFESMISENDRRMVLLLVGRIGDTDIFALFVGDSRTGLEIEEVRGFLRTYLSESLGRYK